MMWRVNQVKLWTQLKKKKLQVTLVVSSNKGTSSPLQVTVGTKYPLTRAKWALLLNLFLTLTLDNKTRPYHHLSPNRETSIEKTTTIMGVIRRGNSASNTDSSESTISINDLLDEYVLGQVYFCWLISTLLSHLTFHLIVSPTNWKTKLLRTKK